ncbi:MAG: LuxR C-terminal-related transcriptional regulator [Oscillospiraceae bacterium]|nr:LuxR C-terminal-related transcriptional regulator [Oscillospiraceae bacterium]
MLTKNRFLSKMSSRLILFLIPVLGILLTAVFVFLNITGLIWSVESKTETLLNAYLSDYSLKVKEYFDGVAAQSIRFSRNVSTLIESELEAKGISFSNLNDDPKGIAELENKVYGIAEQSLYGVSASGVFFILDVTANTKIENAELNKSGMHIKIGSVNNPNPINPPLYLFRGAAELAWQHEIIHHNHWKPEFSTKEYDFFDIIKENSDENLVKNWYVSPVIDLPLTWDDAAFVAVPIYGSDGEFFGVCGFEISKVFFMHAHTLSASEFSNISGLLSLREEDKLRSDKGLESGAYGRQSVSVSDSILLAKPKGVLTSYSDGLDNFIGIGEKIQLSPLDGDNKWEITVMVLESEYNAQTRDQRLLIYLLLVLVTAVSVLASILLSIRYVQPITAGLAMIRKGGTERTNIPEIDDLLDFLAEQDAMREKKGIKVEESSPVVANYSSFMSSLDTLTSREREVFDCYIEGMTAMEIADQRNISLSTVKFHNRNIYTKLNIGSRAELLLLASMMQNAEIQE